MTLLCTSQRGFVVNMLRSVEKKKKGANSIQEVNIERRCQIVNAESQIKKIESKKVKESSMIFELRSA